MLLQVGKEDAAVPGEGWGWVFRVTMVCWSAWTSGGIAGAQTSPVVRVNWRTVGVLGTSGNSLRHLPQGLDSLYLDLI